MAKPRVCGLWAGLAAALVGPATAGAAERLAERAAVGDAAQVVVEMKAEGQYRPVAGPDAARDKKGARPLALKVTTRLEFAERVRAVGPDGSAVRTVRQVGRASAVIGGEVRPIGSQLRPEVALIVAERRPGKVVAWSPGGPLTRSELELVESAGDPLVLSALMPGRAVAVGDHWTVGPDAARGVSGYDALAINHLEATLERLDADAARVALKGEIRGAALGGEGVMACTGHYTFDRKAGRVDALVLQRHEVRKPGPVEAGLDVNSTLTVTRRGAEVPPELSDSALDGLPLEPGPGRELLLFQAPDGKYAFLHDRDWHLFWDDERQTVLKRLDLGEVVAQCNLAVGPQAGPGRHQDPAQFRDDVKKALGKRFGQVLGAGPIEGAPADEFRYKLSVQGEEGGTPIVWYYYLIAAPDGSQLLATFTLAAAQSGRFGDQDGQLVGSLRWRSASESAGAK